MIEASCHCGTVLIELRRPPAEVTDCNCSICRRYGVLWAYYEVAEATLPDGADLTDTYVWDDRAISFHRCQICGCVTHWTSNTGENRLGVNARLMSPDVVRVARVRHLDGAVTERYLD